MRVVRETGQSLGDIARAPYHQTLWIWAHAVGRDHRESLIRAGERVDLAASVAVGFHEPRRLGELVREHQGAVGLLPTREESMKKGEALIAEMDRVAARLEAQERAAADSPVAAAETQPGVGGGAA